MKTLHSFALFAVPSVLILSLLYGCEPKKKTTPQEKSIARSDSLERVINGEYLVHSRVRCLDCHSQRNWDLFGGPVIEGTEGMGGMEFTKEFGGVDGTVYARNITPAAIRDWTDEELLRAITQGISQNGDTLHPIMPYAHFNKLAEDELMDIIFYLRALNPIENKLPERKLSKPVGKLYPTSLIRNIDDNVKPPDMNLVKYGEYLVETAGCIDCHTPVNDKREYQTNKLFAGGFTFTHEKFTAVSGNITPDSVTGIGAWTEEVFLTKFTMYRDPENYNYNPGRKNTFMPWLSFSNLDDYDLKAIYAYLRTQKPVTNQVNKFPE